MPGATGPTTTVRMNINGRDWQLRLEPRTTLLDALRDGVGLTGTKKGCGRGECGACTVHIDGRRVLYPMTLAAMQDAKRITTIEGLERNAQLHAVQAAFVIHDGFQAGAVPNTGWFEPHGAWRPRATSGCRIPAARDRRPSDVHLDQTL
jgi:xanthine dehydrogenase iron-sulfur cluster and FAD-binding subunit A